MKDITVETGDGAVRGRWRGRSAAFYGIPYAAAPVGPLAFALPVRPSSWSGVRDATVPGPTAQRRGFGGTIPEPSVPGDDILTVNVFTPDNAPETLLPVLVWIHGGAYIAGSPISPWYDGGAFNSKGIVVVSIGYRLGIAGFAHLDDAPPNRGVHDWLAALDWVQENIAAFGGDPRRVTIAGQSAGGGAVLTLLGIDRIGDLAAQAIAMSPVTSLTSPADARRTIVRLSDQLKLAPTTAALGSLSREPLADLPWALPNVFGAAPDSADSSTDPVGLVQAILSSLEFSPVFDGELVRMPLTETPRSAAGRGIPLLIGATAQEFNGLVPGSATVGVPADRAIELLGVDRAGASEYAERRSQLRGSALLGQALTDLLIRAGVPKIADSRDHTWVYDFTWPGRGEMDRGLAFHCLDLPFAWGTTGTPEARRATGDWPQRLTDEMHGSWASFVSDGTPGWPSYAEGRVVRCFNDPGGLANDSYAAERALSAAGDQR